MAVKIGHASISEKGTITGQAGDQNGKEVFTRNWYKHSKGWVTLIPTDPKMLEPIAVAMERACANDDIGYDQSENRTLWNNVKPYGYDPAKTTKKVETDCAELGAVCAQFALVQTGKDAVVADSYTANLADNLVKTGYFRKLIEDKYTDRDDYLLRGMIQVTRTKGHCWVILSNGDKASLNEFYDEENHDIPEAAPADPDVPDYMTFEIAKGTWNVRTGPGTKYESVGKVKGGTKVEGVDTDGWIPVIYKGEVRWIGPKAVKK